MGAKPKKRSAPRRRSAPPPPEPASPIVAFKENVSWKWFLGWVAAISLILGAIVAYRNAHPIIEPLAPSTRGYTREYTEEHTKQKLEPISKWMGDYDGYRATQLIEATKSNLIQLNQNLILAKKELTSNPESRFLRDAVEQLEAQIVDTRRRIEEYEALRAKRK